MTQEAKQTEVPNLEATSDGKRYSHQNNDSKDFSKARRENTKRISPILYVELK